MSDDIKELANAVAGELAVEHCSFYGDKTSKASKGFFLKQLYSSWGLTAHRGWAQFLLDRRTLIRLALAYKESIMGSYFHLEVDHHSGPGP